MNAPLCRLPTLPRDHAPSAPALSGPALLAHAIREAFPGRIAVVSSFGAESAVLLALVAEIDPAVPVLFLETGQHFPETLAYRRHLAESLGLKDVRDIGPSRATLAQADPEGQLWHFDPDACCALRKVAPLNQALAGEALAPFDAWVTGRKRHQAATRAALPCLELVDGKVKINPLAEWTPAMIEAEMVRRGLPRHPLLARGYRSIGCAPCTRPTRASDDPRAGRWAGMAKTECGIHRPVSPSPVNSPGRPVLSQAAAEHP